MTPTIEARGLTKRFCEAQALDGLDAVFGGVAVSRVARTH